MHLTIDKYEWSETVDEVTLIIPIENVKKQNSDILVTSQYIKLKFSNYFFETDLRFPVDPELSKVVFSDDAVYFHLKKVEPEMWQQLRSDNKDSKEFMMQLRQKAMAEHQTRLLEMDKKKQETKTTNQKASLNEMMRMEEVDRNRIKQEKDFAIQGAVSQLEEWKMQQKVKSQEIRKELTENDLLLQKLEKIIPKQISKSQASNSSMVRSSKEMISPKAPSHPALCEKPEKNIALPKKEIPSLRQTSTINVKFTPRVFPTPERESVKEKEDEWLAKQEEIRRKRAECFLEDLGENEADPIWLKNKANKLFHAGEFEGAVTAYDMAVKLNPEMFVLFLNRAACQLKLGNLFRAVEDANRALELLQPAVEANRLSRIKAHLRRGTALIRLQMVREGLLDLHEAKRLDPQNETLAAQVAQVERESAMLSAA